MYVYAASTHRKRCVLAACRLIVSLFKVFLCNLLVFQLILLLVI